MPQSRLDYWQPKLERNQNRDAVNKAELKRLGWKVLVIWECQVADTARLARKLEKFLGY